MLLLNALEVRVAVNLDVTFLHKARIRVLGDVMAPRNHGAKEQANYKAQDALI
jgi:hypothetical protein